MQMNVDVKMGQLPKSWNEKAKSITFCVTEDCNLVCKYCYMTGKNNKKKMTFATAKKTVDYILANREEFDNEAAVWEFIGGEPFLEIELIDQICDYIKQQMYLNNHPWFDKYRFNFSTNGVLYHTPQVQKFIHKNSGHLSIGISVDGNKIKHDLQRIKPDGSGSYDDVVKNVPLWQKQFPGAPTKATFAHDDLPHLKDSIISLWNLGIKTVAANVVFEDVWNDGDDEIFENQLKDLADYIIENQLWKGYSVRFFDPSIGNPLTEEDLNKNYCGSGRMLAIDTDGKFYPCIRFYDISLNNKRGYTIGDASRGIDNDKIRPFLALTLKSQSTEECINCEVASGCSWCTACNYDMADTETIYQRVSFICKMHKANVRAKDYFWNKYSEATGELSECDRLRMSKNRFRKVGEQRKWLQFITSDKIITQCGKRRKIIDDENNMGMDVFEKGLDFAKKNEFQPIILGNVSFPDFDIEQYPTISSSISKYKNANSILIYDNFVDEVLNTGGTCILNINKYNIHNIVEYICKLCSVNERVNLTLEDIENWNTEDVEAYRIQLDEVVKFLFLRFKNDKPVEVNILTDLWDIESMDNCGAGEKNFALAPNGKIYICPTFYFTDPQDFIGDLDKGISIPNSQLLNIKNAPICTRCDAYHCSRCKYLNKRLTREINIPSHIQCEISHIERAKSRELQIMLLKKDIMDFKKILGAIEYIDPIEKIKGEWGT